MGRAGRKIIDGLKEAFAGNFAAVTIEGHRWVRMRASDAELAQRLSWHADRLDKANYGDGNAMTDALVADIREAVDFIRGRRHD